MKRHLHQLILGLVLFSAGHLSLQAQGAPFFQESKAGAEVIKANRGDQSGSITNHFMKVISRAANKGMDQVRLIVAYEHHLRLTQFLNDRIKTYAALKNIGVTGDTQYKGFSLENLLKPSVVSFDLALQIGQMGALDGSRKVYSFDNINLSGAVAKIADFIHQDSTGRLNQNKLLLENLSFSYKVEDKQKFDQYTALIDDYQNAASELETIYNELLGIHPEDLDGLGAQDQRLQSLQQRIVVIQDQNYEGKLGLKSNMDPAKFVPRLRDSQNLSRDLRTQISESIRVLPVLYYERAMARLNLGQRPGAIHDLNRSVELDPVFSPSHFQLAVIAYEDGNVGDSRTRLINILTQMQPDPNTQKEASNMLGGMVNADLAAARKQVQQKQFANAIEILGPIQSLCVDVPSLNCSQEAVDLTFKAHRGIYTSFLTAARQDMGAGRYQEAEKKAQGALDYQQQYASILTDGSEALQALNGIRRKSYQQMVQDAARLLDQKQFEQAEATIVSAIQMGEQYPEAVSSTSDSRQLLNRIKQEEYKVLIVNGDKDLQAGKFRRALGTLERARSFEQPYNVPVDTRLWGLIQASARGVVQADLTGATNAAQSNQLPKARELAKTATNMMSDYNLNEDAELQSMVENLQGSIFNQECVNAQSQFNGIVSEAENHERNGDFISAEATYLRAVDVSRQNQACGIDLNNVNAKLRELGPPSAYQKKVKEARTMVDRALYRKAVDTYQQAGRDHAAGNLAKFGLGHSELIDFMTGIGRNGFLLHGADHFLDEGDLETSLDLVRMLARRGVPKFQIKPVQLRLGAALATRDIEQSSGGTWKTNALRHTQGDKGLKYVYKAYKKQWKKMS